MTDGRPHRRLSPDALALVAMRFRVLGQPLRLRILQVLAGGERAVTELAREVGTTQPNVSRHLGVLEEAGLVRRRPHGTAVLCALGDRTVFDLCDTVCRSLARRLDEQSAMLAARPARRRSLPPPSVRTSSEAARSRR